VLRQEKEVPLIVGMMALAAFHSFSLLLYSPSALSVYINQPKVLVRSEIYHYIHTNRME